MKTIYQPEVIQHTENLIEGLIDADFFNDYEITDLSYAKQYLNEYFTQKFIEGTLNEETDGIFTEDEFEVMLREIAAGTVLFELKKNGLVDSYEDDTTEEIFFLTEKGKELTNKSKI